MRGRGAGGLERRSQRDCTQVGGGQQGRQENAAARLPAGREAASPNFDSAVLPAGTPAAPHQPGSRCRTLWEMRMSSDTDPALLSSFCVLRFWEGWVAASKSSTTQSRRLMVTCRHAGRGARRQAGSSAAEGAGDIRLSCQHIGAAGTCRTGCRLQRVPGARRRGARRAERAGSRAGQARARVQGAACGLSRAR